MLTAAIVTSNTPGSTPLRACLQQTGLVSFVGEWPVQSEPLKLKPWDPVPDVVLLELGRDPEPFFTLATQLRRLFPAVRIIACSPVGEPSSELLLQAMRSGVQEFLPHPLDPAVLKEVLARFLGEHDAHKAKPAEKVILVMGSKGGVGTSTIAVNLGVQLAELTKRRVVLLDFARPMGHASLLLDLQPRYWLRDATSNLDRLDGHFFQGLLTRHKSHLEVLAGTTHPEEWERVSIPALTRVTNVAQSLFDFVLVDYGSLYSPEWNSLFKQARTILLVAEANVLSLWSLERQLAATAALGLEPERVRIIVNRWNQGDDEALKTVEKNTKRPIFACVPNDFRQVSRATNLGVPLSGNHNNPVLFNFRQLAGQLAGIAPAAAGKRAGLTKPFSLLSRG